MAELVCEAIPGASLQFTAAMRVRQGGKSVSNIAVGSIGVWSGVLRSPFIIHTALPCSSSLKFPFTAFSKSFQSCSPQILVPQKW